MLLQPKMPPAPTLPDAGSHPVTHASVPACSCQHAQASAIPARRPLPSVSTGAVAAVLLGGVVLTALLTAVAVSAVSVAVAAVVLRSLLKQHHRH